MMARFRENSSNSRRELRIFSSIPLCPKAKIKPHLRGVKMKVGNISIDLNHYFELLWCSQCKMRMNLIIGSRGDYMHLKAHGRDITYFCKITSMIFRENISMNILLT